MNSISSADGSTTLSDAGSHKRGRLRRWIEAVAIFGDSEASLVVATAIFIMAIAVATSSGDSSSTSLLSIVVPPWFHSIAATISTRIYSVDRSQSRNGLDPPIDLGPMPSLDPPVIYDVSQVCQSLEGSHCVVLPTVRQAYERDGVIAVRGLIDAPLLERLDAESLRWISRGTSPRKGSTQFQTVHHGALFQADTTASSNQANNAFFALAAQSRIPAVVAALLNLTHDNLRVMRDIFLTKDRDPYTCGFHTDDLGFWPVTPDSPPGLNAWVALDDYTNLERGGGFGLAVQSHRASWSPYAQYITGASTTFPVTGYQNVSDLFHRRTGSGTCNIAQSAPAIHQRMLDSERIYPAQPGDVVLHDRWLFHRTIPMQQNAAPDLILRRYSIRYGPGNSIIPPGYGVEPSVLYDAANGGRSAETVAATLPWYPRVWPDVSATEMANWEQLVAEGGPMEQALALRRERLREMKPYQLKLAKQLMAASQNARHERPSMATKVTGKH
jgi:ectoine hydroxylase-related dioxygenase (phytanoyl-CoA dioxygenase family)